MGRRSNNLNQLMVNEQLLQKKLSKLRTELDGMYEDVSRVKSEINGTVNDITQLLASRREELLKQVDNAVRVKMESVNNSMMTVAVALGKLQHARMNNIDSLDMVHAMEELHIFDNLESGNGQPKLRVALPVDKLGDYLSSWRIVGGAAESVEEEEDDEFELDAEFVHFDEAEDSSSSVGILPSVDDVSCRSEGDNNMYTFVKPEFCKMEDDKAQVREWLAFMKTRKVSEICMPKSNEPYSEYLRGPACRSPASSKRSCTGYSHRSDTQEWLKPRRRPSINQSGAKQLAIRGRPLEFPCLRPDSDIWVRKTARKTQVGELRYNASKLVPAHYTSPPSFWIKPMSVKKSLS